MRGHTLGHAVVRTGHNKICPICNGVMSSSDMGIYNHLRMHVKKGEMKKSEALELRKKLTGKEDV